MCSTCNVDNFTLNEETKKLEQVLGNGDLLLKYDPDGKNYKLGVKDQKNADFVCYRCPTCGRKLY